MTPETFERELNARCSYGGTSHEYRLRWSPKKAVWAIEQAAEPHTKLAEVSPRLRGSDDWIRRRDRYTLVAHVSPTPTFTCTQCGTRLSASPLEWREVKCAVCHDSRTYNNTQYFIAYFPLCDRLLTHLERTAPKRGYEWVRTDVHGANAANSARQDRDFANHAEAGLLDYRNIIGQNPRVGYGRGPASFGEKAQF